MATAIVSGRVDEDVKDRVARLIQAAGLSAGDVIKTVWDTIARTGEVPLLPVEDSEAEARRKRFAAFMELRASLPPCPALVEMDDTAMRAQVAERYEEGLGTPLPSAPDAMVPVASEPAASTCKKGGASHGA